MIDHRAICIVTENGDVVVVVSFFNSLLYFFERKVEGPIYIEFTVDHEKVIVLTKQI